MHAKGNTSSQIGFRLSLRLKMACDFAAVREAARSACAWLATQNVSAEELAAWEMALVEAGNNAVEHSPPRSRLLPIELEISCGEADVEARVSDHTAGFDLPDEIALPDIESEGGRGLFLIQSMTDSLAYLRGRGENTMVMRRRVALAQPEAPVLLGLQRRLAENEVALKEMSEELSSSYESLVAMFRYSAELGRNTDLRDFARRLLKDLMQLTEADAVVLRMLSPDKQLDLFVVLPEDLSERLSQRRPGLEHGGVESEAMRTCEDVWFGSDHPLHAQDPLQAIPGLTLGISHSFGSNDRPMGAISLCRCGSNFAFRSDQINLLHTFIDFLAIQIINERLLDERTKARVMRRELDIAASIQRSLLPVALADCRPFEIAASCLNAREVGGDFYDVIQVGNQGVLLVIADVMGKGVPAALFAALLRSTVRSMPTLFSHPSELLSAVNRVLHDDLSRVDMFITAKMIFLDFSQPRMLSASAGHCPLLIRYPGEKSAREADDAGLPLGIETTTRYAQTTIPFSPGLVALLYTDGLTESRNPAGELFGTARLAETLAEAATRPSLALARDAMLARLSQFQSDAPLADDQTFILLRHAL